VWSASQPWMAARVIQLWPLGVSVCVWGNDVYIYTHTPPTWHTHHTPGGRRGRRRDASEHKAIGAAEQRGAREACETWITRTPRDMSRRQDTFTCLSPLRFHMHTEHHHTCRELELGVSVCVWGNDVYIYTHTPPTWHTHHTPCSPVCIPPQLSRGAAAARGRGTEAGGRWSMPESM